MGWAILIFLDINIPHLKIEVGNLENIRSRGQVKDDNSAKRNQLNAVVRSHQSTFSIIYSYYPFTNSFLSIVIIPKSLDHRIRSLELFRFLPVPAMHTAVGNCLTLECNSRTIQIFDFNFANNMSVPEVY